jgi:uncharacterized protein (DUF2249 family)/hemerythrin-like domain-containing protein
MRAQDSEVGKNHGIDRGENPRDGLSPRAVSLAGEHSVLLREVTTRAESVLLEADAGRWPAHELHAFVDYLQLEVLRQISDEDWEIYRAARQAREEFARLRTEHLELRLSIDDLTEAAVGRGERTPARLAAHIRELVSQIQSHLEAEEQLLSDSIPSMSSLGSQPHEWYPLTEGPVIDLERLPGPRGADAVFDRLLQLRVGEGIELESGSEPGPLLNRLRRGDPGAYAVDISVHGPPRWRARVMRRPPAPPLTPYAR